MSALEAKSLESIKREVKQLEQKGLDDVAPHLNRLLTHISEKHLGSFTSRAQGLVITGSTWSAKVVAAIRSLKIRIDDMCNQCKKSMLLKVENNARQE